jgi:DsbC/DsbD-like thiol-disulfide interchange protein
MHSIPVRFRRHGVQNVAAGLFVLQAALPACAADASKWDANPRSAVRLIAADMAGKADAPVLRAGVEVKLATGWKTYWRYPGDSGVPPRFGFARSENVKDVVVRWPAPHRFADDGEVTIGYKGDVIFPLVVVPKDPRKPALLRLDLDYAVCERLCVPANAKAELLLPGEASADDGILLAAEARVPKRVVAGEPAPLAIRSVTREPGGAEPRVVVDVAVPDGAATIDLFAEGPTPDWALPVPIAVGGAPAGTKRFAFDVTGQPDGASTANVALTLTAVADDRAIEVVVRLD